MTDESKAPNIWWSGPTKREHEFLAGVVKLAQNRKNLEEIQQQLENRIAHIREFENNYDWTTVIGYGLGIAGGAGLILGLMSQSIHDFGFYLLAISFFFMWEWFYTSFFHPDEVSISSFQLTHSREFHIILAVQFSEYWLEYLIFPAMKGNWFFWIPGLLIVIAGQAIRTSAMWTAGRSFNHLIQEHKRSDHVLVTNGIYQYLRHPSYFGFFWWSVGLGILLGSPLTIAASAYASYSFFSERIPYEEETLVRHFGEDYIKYRKRTPTGIPLIP